MKMTKSFIAAIMTIVLSVSIISAQSKAKKSGAPASSKPVAAVITFNGGEDVRSIAHDAENVYVTMAYTNRMIVINKSTGEISEVKASDEITSVAVANGKCYYFINGSGLFSYNPATRQSEGPLFDLVHGGGSEVKLAVSPDGNFLNCEGTVIDLESGEAVLFNQSGPEIAVNNAGGAFHSDPAPIYCNPDGDEYRLTNSITVNGIYPDTVTGTTIWACHQGVGYTPIEPLPTDAVRFVKIPDLQTEGRVINAVSRDDNGNFVFLTTWGVGFGGKTLEDPVKLQKDLPLGIKNEYGSALTIGSPTVVTADGNGNLVFGSNAYNCLYIYNPAGLNGYTALKGKSVRF